MVSINAHQLKQKLDDKEDMLLVDVREAFEHDVFNIGGTLIPLGEIFDHINIIPRDKPVIFYCQKGIRSQIAIQRLQEKFQFSNLINLTGGMDAWKKEIS